MAEWEPWRVLRERAHLILRWADLPTDVDGTWEPNPDGTATITLDARLDRRARRATLAHELVHDERGIAYPADAPEGLVQREEETVERIAASRLVPLDELACFVERTVDSGEGVTARLVAEEFDVPVEVAERALRLLEMRTRAPSHPAWRATPG